MLAVIVSPHGFTTALMSEASIVPGASHRRITPTACPGRVLGAASQVRSCFVQPSQLVIQLRVARPLQTDRTAFTVISFPASSKLFIFMIVPSVNVIPCVYAGVHVEYPCGRYDRELTFSVYVQP